MEIPSRHRTLTRLSTLALLAPALLAACLGSTDSKQPATASAPYFEQPADGVLDFGTIAVGSSAERMIILRNPASATVSLQPIGTLSDASFALPLATGAEITASGALSIKATFVPTISGTHQAVAHLQFGSGASLDLTLRANALGAPCAALPYSAVDFGWVPIGSTERRTITISNSLPVTWNIQVSAITGDGASGFRIVDALNPGPKPVPGSGGLDITIEFAPTTTASYEAQLSFSSASCDATTVRLIGHGSDGILECTPSITAAPHLDFGFTALGLSTRRELTCVNRTGADVGLTLAGITQPHGSAPFAVEGGLRSETIPGGGSTTVSVTFEPSVLGEFAGALALATTDSRQPSATVVLSGTGGGPRAAVTPTSINFGLVAVGMPAAKQMLTIANEGSAVSDVSGNLRFRARAGETWTDKRPEIIGSAAFAVEWPPTAYPQEGIVAGSSIPTFVTFSPTAAGSVTATLRIYTNDANEKVEVALEGAAIQAAPCHVDVAPPSLVFGSMEVGRPTTLALSITNTATDAADACVISVQPPASTEPWALIDAPIEAETLAARATRTMRVRMAPTAGMAPVSSELRVNVSNPAQPSIAIPVRGSLQTNFCVVLSTRDIDFGTSTFGSQCRARERAVRVYNACGAPLTVHSVELGQGTSSEYSLPGLPSLPRALSGGTMFEFTVAYSPEDATDDAGSVAIQAGSTTPLDKYVIPIAGRGSQSALRREDISLPATPMIDVLFVVADSTILDQQTALSQNAATLFAAANSQDADYHLGITTTSVGSSYAAGRLLPLTGTNPRVITPSTPNGQQEFATRVVVGYAGSGREELLRPIHLALSQPLVSGHNAGFVRPDAYLAAVILSDAADQDPFLAPVSFYEDFLINLKGNRNRVSVSGILATLQTEPPYSMGCSYDSSDAGLDQRVKKVIADTGGVVEEICSTNWANTVQRIANRVFGPRATLFLVGKPDTAQPVSLDINGINFPAVGSHGEQRWRYDSTLNAIVFNEAAGGLEWGSTATIMYSEMCQ